MQARLFTPMFNLRGSRTLGSPQNAPKSKQQPTGEHRKSGTRRLPVMSARLACFFSVVHVIAAARVTVCASSGMAKLAPAAPRSPLPVRRMRSPASNSHASPHAAALSQHAQQQGNASEKTGSDTRGPSGSPFNVCLHAVHQAACADRRDDDAAAEHSRRLSDAAAEHSRRLSVVRLNENPDAVKSFALQFGQYALKEANVVLQLAEVSSVDAASVALKLTLIDASLHGSVDHQRILHVRVPLPAAYESISAATQGISQLLNQLDVAQNASQQEQDAEMPEWGV